VEAVGPGDGGVGSGSVSYAWMIDWAEVALVSVGLTVVAAVASVVVRAETRGIRGASAALIALPFLVLGAIWLSDGRELAALMAVVSGAWLVAVLWQANSVGTQRRAAPA